MKFIFKIVLLITITANFIFANNKDDILDRFNVLFISSYNNAFPSIPNQIAGIKNILEEDKYKLDIEFMDTKRFDPQIIEPIFYKILDTKRKVLENYDAIIVGDDNALHFINKYQEDFFLNKPIVFLGINNIKFAKEMSKNDYISGILEESSDKETIELIESMHPQNEKIIALIDNTVTTQAILKNLDKKMINKLELLNVSEYTFNEFQEKLKTLKGKPLLYISSFLDKNSNRIDFYNSIKMIKNATKSPIYHFYEHGIGIGLLGGKVILFKEQGKEAAKIVKEVLSGTNIKNIHYKKPINRYLFDYKELTKYNLLEKIPENSLLINRPKSFLDQSLTEILIEVIVLLSIIFIVILFLLFKLREKSKKLLNSYKDVQTIINETTEGIILTRNDICVNVNNSALKLLKYKKEELKNKHISEIIDLEEHKNENYESNFTDSEGKLIPFLVHEKTIMLKNTPTTIYAIIDLSEIKKKEKMMQEHLKMSAIGRMIGNISHQWRQPLNVITSTAGRWKIFEELGNLDKDEMIKDTDVILDHAERLSTIINDFMYFFKDEKSQDSFNMTELFKNLLDLEKTSIEMHFIKVLHNINSTTQLNYNKNEILQIFLHIITNSIEALSKNIEADRLLFIDVKEDEKNIIVSILDNAKGVDEDIIDSIFEPYISTKDQLNGYGLGLYMVYTTLNKINANIVIKNKIFNIKETEHKGLDITITIPKTEGLTN